MSDERRYHDNEVRRIFEDATAAPSEESSESMALAGSSEGLTLAELQAIGREVGVAPERIAAAAGALDRPVPAPAPTRRLAGLPLSVGRTVELPRAPTDREWELLVAELRETFGARGKAGGTGLSRHWTNGNLHAYVEPSREGYRLRLGTLKGNAVMFNNLGLGFLGLGLFLAVLSFFLGGDLAEAALISAMGAAAMVANAVRLPGWARTRERQMEEIAERATTLLAAPPRDDAGG